MTRGYDLIITFFAVCDNIIHDITYATYILQLHCEAIPFENFFWLDGRKEKKNSCFKVKRNINNNKLCPDTTTLFHRGVPFSIKLSILGSGHIAHYSRAGLKSDPESV